MRKRRSQKLKLKFWGKPEAIEKFRHHLEEYFICVISTTKPSDQGDYHAYATLEVGEG